MPPLSGWTLWITGLVGKAPAFDSVMSLLVSDFFIPVVICLFILGLWLGHPDPDRREHLQRTIMNAAIAIGIAALVVHIINFYHFWPRPFDESLTDPAIQQSASYAVNTIFYATHDPSFPSNAATVSFAAATGIWLGNRRAGAVLYMLAFLWSFARFYGGVHFFVDLACGAVIGVIASLMISKVFTPRIEPLQTIALKVARFIYIA